MKDLRQRLQGYEFKYDPAAWEEMHQLLDATPVAIEAGKPGWWRRFFSSYLPILALPLAIVGFLLLSAFNSRLLIVDQPTKSAPTGNDVNLSVETRPWVAANRYKEEELETKGLEGIRTPAGEKLPADVPSTIHAVETSQKVKAKKQAPPISAETIEPESNEVPATEILSPLPRENNRRPLEPLSPTKLAKNPPWENIDVLHRPPSVTFLAAVPPLPTAALPLKRRTKRAFLLDIGLEHLWLNQHSLSGGQLGVYRSLGRRTGLELFANYYQGAHEAWVFNRQVFAQAQEEYGSIGMNLSYRLLARYPHQLNSRAGLSYYWGNSKQYIVSQSPDTVDLLIDVEEDVAGQLGLDYRYFFNHRISTSFRLDYYPSDDSIFKIGISLGIRL